MELYSDMCPHCKFLHETILPSIVADYVNTGNAYLVFREFPLAIPQHGYSRPAVNFGVLDHDGKSLESVAPVLTPDEQKKVQALASDPGVLAEAQRDYEHGQKARVNSTPNVVITYKLRQQPWSEWSSYPLFRSYVNDLLKK